MSGSSRKEIKDISEHTAVCLIKFGILAMFAGDVSKFFVLYIKDFTEKPSCRTNFSCIIIIISAFRTGEVNFFAHFLAPLVQDKFKEGIASFFLLYLMILYR